MTFGVRLKKARRHAGSRFETPLAFDDTVQNNWGVNVPPLSSVTFELQ
jgi:hypothetical protein